MWNDPLVQILQQRGIGVGKVELDGEVVNRLHTVDRGIERTPGGAEILVDQRGIGIDHIFSRERLAVMKHDP